MCVGIPGKIVEIDKERENYAFVEISGVRREVNITIVKESEGFGLGSWVLIHVGFALSVLDEEDAKETLKALEAMGELEEDAAEFLSRAH